MRSLAQGCAVALMLSGFACAEPVQPVDVVAEQEVLLETDRAWAGAAAAGDVERLTTFWADDAVNYFPGAPAARGKAEIRALVRRNRSRPGFSLSWEPEEAVVAGAGDLGYTTGTFAVSADNAEGVRETQEGHYVAIWRKQADGAWKCVVESTIFGPSPEPPTAPGGE